VDTRALFRISLILGIIISVSALIAVRSIHTEERGMELALIAAMAVGGFFFISGLVGVLHEPPMTEEEEEEALAVQRVTSTRPPISVSAAVAIYVLVLTVVAGLVVGIALRDAGAGIQTFTAGMILGGVIWGLGLVLGHRPVEE
jgi:hypothetical protein